jgi:CRP/FNR family transcriptional regulator
MQDSHKVTQLKILNNICPQCGVRHLCPVNALNASERERFGNATMHTERLNREQHLFWASDPLRFIYIIHSGSFKTYIENENGDIQMTAFHFQGDILGLNSMVEDVHTCSAVALETTNVCKIPLAELEKMMTQYPTLSRILMNRLSREIIVNQRMLFVLGMMNKDQKVADFLIRMSRERKQRGRSSIVLDLSMKRTDIAYHLGIAPETVSRIFRVFQDKGIISVKRREISIVDFEALKSLSLYDDTETGMNTEIISCK